MAEAQMFSVQGEDQSFTFPQSHVYVGVEFADFIYQGNPAPFGGNYEFTGPLLRLEIETPNINLFMGTGGKLTGLDNATYFQAGIKGRYRFTIITNSFMDVRVPIQLHSDIITVTNPSDLNTGSQFQQGALLFGGGLNFLVRPGELMDVELFAIPNAGISFSTGGVFGGVVRELQLGMHIMREQVFGSIGLTAGYNYRLRTYDIDRETYDYHLTGHTAKVGITF
ncbi:MAG: hypothetical protein U5K31_08235 [Balneolaceae bacterium]|nr:hypothetical protein [Balneolaceae bacterium]